MATEEEAPAVNEPTLADLINCKRASGHDPKFEALMRKPWYCPHCKCSKTILQTAIPVGQPERDLLCSECGREGIKPINGDGDALFKKFVMALAPYNRSGTA